MIRPAGAFTPPGLRRLAQDGPVETPPTDAPPPPKEQEVKPELRNVARRYNSSRATANYVSGMAVGVGKETVATVVQSPYLAGKIIQNVWKAETIGPNLKVLGTLAAIPGALLSIPAAPFYGAYSGFQAAYDGMRDRDGKQLLTKDTSPDVARSVFPAEISPDNTEPRTMTGHLVDGLNKFGAAKLAEGQKPYDVPILSPVFSLAGGVVSGLISGAVGLVAGEVAGAITTVKQAAGAFTGDKPATERVVQFIASPLNLVVMPVALAWNGIKESVPRGFDDGWHHGPVKPIVDTAKASAGVAAGVIKEAWELKP